MTDLRGVCVGAGYFSQYHYEAWSRIPEVRITAVCNRELDQGHAVAERYGIGTVYPFAEFDRMLDRERPDFVDIITPPETHLDLVRKASSRGVAIISQKPLAPTWEESLSVVALARAAGVRFAVHENWRWQPWYREMKRWLDAGELGELFSIGIRMRMGDGWGEDAYLSRQPFFRTYPRLFVFETGVHYLDTFRFLGGEVDTVYARLQRRNPVILGEDAAQIVVGFRSGATAILDASRYNEAETADARYTFGTVRLDGSAGHIELDLDGNLTFKPLGGPTRPIEYPHDRGGFAGDCVHAFQRHVTDRMLDGKPFESTGEDYLKTVALVEACYRSAETGAVQTPNAVELDADVAS